MQAAQDDEAESALFFGDRRGATSWGGGRFRGFSFDATEFLSIGQDDVHMLQKRILAITPKKADMGGYDIYLIKREKGTRELTTVCQRNSHTIVDLHILISITLRKYHLQPTEELFGFGVTYEVRLSFRINQHHSCFPTPRQRKPTLNWWGRRKLTIFPCCFDMFALLFEAGSLVISPWMIFMN